MTIRNSVFALSFVSLLAPAVAGASDGVIRFTGAIVESTSCRVDMEGRKVGAAAPQVHCDRSAGRVPLPTANIVKVSIQALPPVPGRNGGPDQRYSIVTLDYL
ncbi:MAG: hypothetical protein ACN6PR_16585 [Achromobacter sp.]